jgi:ferredoxin
MSTYLLTTHESQGRTTYGSLGEDVTRPYCSPRCVPQYAGFRTDDSYEFDEKCGGCGVCIPASGEELMQMDEDNRRVFARMFSEGG